MKKLFIFLILLNICCFILAFVVNIPLPFYEWRKGPPMHSYVAYSSNNAHKIFWVATAVFFDMYFFIIFLFHYIIIRKRVILRNWVYFSIILMILGVSFLAVEYDIRLFIKHSPWYTQFRLHPFLYWWNRPNLRHFNCPSDSVPVSTNSFGFRYKEDIPYEKAIDEYRIFVLGDSSAFGHGVRNNETFAAILEKILNSEFNHKIRVINATCPGHSTYQNLIVLKEIVLKFHPDMVIIANNDDHALEYKEDKERANYNTFIRRLNIVLYHSDYYLLFQRVILDIKMFILTKLKIISPPSLVRRVSLEDYKNNLKEFIKIAKKNNIQLIFVKMPINMDTLDFFPDLKKMIYDEAYPKALSQLCQEENQILVDVDAEWRKKKERGLYEAFNYGGYKTEAPYHPSTEGHLRIARQISKEIKITKPYSVETSLAYFIASDRQDAFDELYGGELRDISANNAEIVFNIDTEKIKNLDHFKAGDLVRVFYENSVVTLKASKIISINRYGEAETEANLFKISHYIEGWLETNGKMKVFFDVRDSLTYMPTALSRGDNVGVVYSQGLLKPPMIRRIMKSKRNGVSIFKIPQDESLALNKQIKEHFEENWFKLGQGLWKKIAHSLIRSDGDYEAVKKLFKAVTNKVAKDLKITEEVVLKTIDREAYFKQ